MRENKLILFKSSRYQTMSVFPTFTFLCRLRVCSQVCSQSSCIIQANVYPSTEPNSSSLLNVFFLSVTFKRWCEYEFCLISQHENTKATQKMQLKIMWADVVLAGHFKPPVSKVESVHFTQRLDQSYKFAKGSSLWNGVRAGNVCELLPLVLVIELWLLGCELHMSKRVSNYNVSTWVIPDRGGLLNTKQSDHKRANVPWGSLLWQRKGKNTRKTQFHCWWMLVEQAAPR